jgi:predicted nucleic acid-binding protein
MLREFDVWVVNASPLISLEKIGCLGLLAQLAKEIILPGAVVAEVAAGPRPLLPAQLGQHRLVTGTAVHPMVAAWDLGAGESEVVSCAAANGAVAVLDDRAARNCAAALGIPTKGTLRVLLDAKSLGLVPAIRPLVDGLRSAGLFLSDALIEKALKSAGEF